MSRIKIALVALTLLVSGFAYAGDKKSETKTAAKAKSGTVYYWFSASGTPTYQFANTVADEETRTGCAEGDATCEKGYLSSQLNNPNNPSQGIQPNQTAQASLQIVE